MVDNKLVAAATELPFLFLMLKLFLHSSSALSLDALFYIYIHILNNVIVMFLVSSEC